MPTMEPVQSSSTVKQMRSESPSSQDCLAARKRRCLIKVYPPSASPSPPQFGYLQTPTLSTCPPERSVALAVETGRVDPKKIVSPEDWDMDEDAFEELLSSIPNNEDDLEEFLNSLSDEGQDIEELLNTLPSHETKNPPSSVVRAYDCDSRSAEDFDANLQHSPFSTGPSATINDNNDSLLDEDIDWAAVHESTRIMRKPDGSSGAQEPHTLTTVGHPVSQSVVFDSRSRVPETPPVTRPHSFLSRMLLNPHKTFFDISEMLESNLRRFKHQGDAVYELFARVIYSSRENFHHKQYFQFRSLLKECPPYINGTLTG
ncbi:hypothetical protein B0T10DRAFT_65092 [Thelonectria olida]|uniref:Uncharacterized protein n=1 Tax=Thelonectria olida TaxID=1576542 RepID=A0A9P8W5M3_9HYPO|nr:hypothetical protein B0T10DRAFT_65092 [Thelonectria olida]